MFFYIWNKPTVNNGEGSSGRSLAVGVGDMWNMECDMGHVTCDMLIVTCDM